ncbi:MAG: hypothetical protein ND866_01625 [Pyrinomonadaceae bacterium]|nr:hypothetical protein [Pyrinomonadaceae bacterium]
MDAALLHQGREVDPEKYWFDLGKRWYQDTKSLLKVNDDVRQTAASLTEGAKTDDEKIERLFNFCRTKIKNISDDASGLTAEERKKLKENKSPADTLKRQSGSAANIDLLFAALATAAGYDARIVLAPDRGDLFFDKNIPNDYFLEPSNIAVRIGDEWKSYENSYEVKNGELVFTRGLTQRAATIPAAQYQAIRSFFERIRAAEQAPVVLARK